MIAPVFIANHTTPVPTEQLPIFDSLGAAAHAVVATGMPTYEACRHLAIMIQGLRPEEGTAMQEALDV